MAQFDLDEAGRRLVQQRQDMKAAEVALAKQQQALATAEVQFQAQYDEERQSFETKIREMRKLADERDRSVTVTTEEVRADYAEQPEKLEAVVQKMDIASRQMRRELDKMEARFMAVWVEAERIIAQK